MNLNPDHDVDFLHEQFAKNRRISIPTILEAADAHELRRAAASAPNRNLVFFANGRHFDVDAEGWRRLEEEKRRMTEKIIYAEAQRGFAYQYENVPIYDRWRAKSKLADVLRVAVEFLNGPPFLDFVRRVTGFEEIAFADAQVTLFGPGHFLTLHDDGVAGKNRRAAYVLNLTDEWREDWGGYLNFFDEAGNIESAFKPAFNALNIFAVPTGHSVGVVSPFAGSLRVSITGWLRTETPGAV